MPTRTPATPLLLAIAGGVGALATAGAILAARPGDPPRAPALAGSSDPLAADLERRFREDVRPLLARSCFGCHGPDKARADVRFDRLATVADVMGMSDQLAVARELVTLRQMPPEDEPPLTEHEVLTIQQWIDAARDYYPADGAIDPGWFTIHRLNRAEYRNTLRDLLGIDPSEHDVAANLPPDDTGYGFDNMAAVLSVSPLQVEAYLGAAERALDLSLGPMFLVSTEPRTLRRLSIDGGGRELESGGFFFYSNGGAAERVEIPVTGEYEVTVESWGDPAGDEAPRLAVRFGNRTLKTIDATSTRDRPQVDRVRVRLERGAADLGVHFINDYYVKDVADRNVAVESVAIAGPLDEATVERPAWHARILFEYPAEDSAAAGRAAAEAILTRFVSRAYRRPAAGDDVAGLLGIYDASRGAGDDHERAVRTALAAVLVSPHFLYRTVSHPSPDDPSKTYTLSGHELASRLSYFLWSTMPDDELLACAADGSLVRDQTLRAQVRRMLADPRSRDFSDNFAGQWMLLRNLDSLAIDTAKFPMYTRELRRAMISEATLFFDDVVRNDRPVTDLIEGRSTFINAPLANLYGLPEVEGPGFRRVELPPDSPRGGVLGMAAVLTVTSNPTRTSAVKRGLYVLDQILGAPPPPPPPDIPPLEQARTDAAPGTHVSPRDQLRAHLHNPSCASCHVRMDPLGLSLENFDAIGSWRDADESGPIDATGELPGGEQFKGIADLRRLLMDRKEQFVENLTRKLLTYALGRGLEPFDRPTAARIARLAAERDLRFSAIIEGIVLSEAFRTCRGTER